MTWRVVERSVGWMPYCMQRASPARAAPQPWLRDSFLSPLLFGIASVCRAKLDRTGEGARPHTVLADARSCAAHQYRNLYVNCAEISRGFAKCVPPKVLLLSSM